MTNTTREDDEDQMARICEAEHNMGPLDYCQHCQYRRSITKCGYCNATFEEGKWWAASDSLECDHLDDGVFDLRDDWDSPLVCPVIEIQTVKPCGDPVLTPGIDRCDFHQTWLDNDTTAEMYQRLVAQR